MGRAATSLVFNWILRRSPVRVREKPASEHGGPREGHSTPEEQRRSEDRGDEKYRSRHRH